MYCKDCKNFIPAFNIDVEEANYSKNIRGVCGLNNNRKNSEDECLIK